MIRWRNQLNINYIFWKFYELWEGEVTDNKATIWSTWRCFCHWFSVSVCIPNICIPICNIVPCVLLDVYCTLKCFDMQIYNVLIKHISLVNIYFMNRKYKSLSIFMSMYISLFTVLILLENCRLQTIILSYTPLAYKIFAGSGF